MRGCLDEVVYPAEPLFHRQVQAHREEGWIAGSTETPAIKGAAPRAASHVVTAPSRRSAPPGSAADTPLAAMWAHLRTLHLADGPDEIHLRSIARLELAKARKRIRG